MSDGFQEQTIEVSGRKTRLLHAGNPEAPYAVFLHGGIPGVTPYCSGAHIWGDSLRPFLAGRRVMVLDLPGSGGTSLGDDPFTIESVGKHVLAATSSLGAADFDLVAHDTGGLVGLWLAMEEPARLRSLSIVASASATPQGDSLDNLLLTAPPAPLWSAESQRWALDRLSYSHMHLSPAFMSACVRAGEGAVHRQAVNAQASLQPAFAASVGKVKYRLWATVRTAGIQVPTQLVWGANDPTISQAGGYALFSAIAQKQSASHFHLVNRAGHFPFREQPEAFHHMVSAFQNGILQGPAGYSSSPR